MAAWMSLGEPVEPEWQMAIYVTLLYVMFTATSFIQFNTGEKADAIPEEVKRQGNDLNEIQNAVRDEGEENEKDYEN